MTTEREGFEADAWAAAAEIVDRQCAPVTARLLELTRPATGQRVLELGAATGAVGLAARELVGASGTVVVSDVEPEMVARAQERIAALGADGVAARVLDLEAIAEPDASYDVVVARMAVQFTAQPGDAVAEMCRVAVPGGRVAFAVWGARDDNPWLGALLDAVSEQLGFTIPPPGVPGPFALSDPALVRDLLDAAPLGACGVEAVDLVMSHESADAWWSRVVALAGPLAALLSSLPDEARTQIRDRATTAISAYAGGDGLEIPAAALVASGTRAPIR